MKVIVSHRTALTSCSNIAASGQRIAQPCRIRTLQDCICTNRDFKAINLSCLSIDLQSPIDILVPCASRRFSSKALHRHSWNGGLPDGSFYRLTHDVVITSPEFSLLLLSKSLTFNELVLLCSEACGQYLKSDCERGFVDRPPLTNRRRIASYLDKIGTASGASKLRRALRYTVENARSPMETAIGIIMSMPIRLGGFGFGTPQLNSRMDLNDESAYLAGRNYVELDIFYPKHKVAIEYDSNRYHTGADRIASDSRRNNVLRHLGLTVINITWEQVRDPALFEGTMKQVASALGKKHTEASDAYLEKRMQLRKLLLQ